MLLFSLTVISCAKKSGSSSDSTSTTSYVGKWLKSDSTVGLDWRSDSFIYGCTSINNITFSAHGSYSSSNTRLTWWDGSYDTVTSSGSNILLSSNTYSPAELYTNCNPFWTNHTSENTSYTNLAKSIGYWTFTYTITSTWTDNILMASMTSAKNSTDNNYITAGLDEGGNAVIGSYLTSSQIYDILDASDSTYNQYYAFYINSSSSGITAGCYYIYTKNSTPSTCFSITSGTKLYGTPRSYRIISEDDKDKIALQKQKEMTKLINLSSKKLTEQDINAHKRYQQLLQIHNSIDQKPLKRYLQSFGAN
jgi:hypothetical protein